MSICSFVCGIIVGAMGCAAIKYIYFKQRQQKNIKIHPSVFRKIH